MMAVRLALDRKSYMEMQLGENIKCGNLRSPISTPKSLTGMFPVKDYFIVQSQGSKGRIDAQWR
jgi:hypothetical protein